MTRIKSALAAAIVLFACASPVLAGNQLVASGWAGKRAAHPCKAKAVIFRAAALHFGVFKLLKSRVDLFSLIAENSLKA